MSSEGGFIEVACRQLSEKGQSVSGDVYRNKRYKGHTIVVLSDGAGSGVKANIVASVIASMALNYMKMQMSMLKMAKAVVEMFARGNRSEDLAQATFTVVDVSDSGEVEMIEFLNPKRILLRDGKIHDLARKKEVLSIGKGLSVDVYITEFNMVVGDRIVIYSDGVPLSGSSTHRMPEGWCDENVGNFLVDCVTKALDISAAELSRSVILESELNDLYSVKNDMTCISIYYRRPRRVMVCSGPPYHKSSDAELAERVLSYDGTKIVCGGTTAQILSRESGRDISVILKRDPSGLPPESKMEGIDMVTEGVLTLSKVKLLLKTLRNDEVVGRGIDSRFVRELFSHDIIEFVVGTGVNVVHHDPNLPMEIELRRTVIKSIAELLEQKFLKNVRIEYF